MEGLIPFVIHAIKKNRKRSKYEYLSEDCSHAMVGVEGTGFQRPDRESSSHHRRTRSEFHPRQGYEHRQRCYAFAPSEEEEEEKQQQQQQQRGLAPSRSLKEDTLPSAARNGVVGRARAGGFW